LDFLVFTFNLPGKPDTEVSVTKFNVFPVIVKNNI